MAKGGFRGGYGGGMKRAGGMGGGISMDMMKKVQQMQQEMQDAQSEVEAKEFTATAGGGMVSAVVTGKKELVRVNIDPEAVDPEDVDMLCDMIVAAVNEAIRMADSEMNNTMGKITGGLNLPM